MMLWPSKNPQKANTMKKPNTLILENIPDDVMAALEAMTPEGTTTASYCALLLLKHASKNLSSVRLR